MDLCFALAYDKKIQIKTTVVAHRFRTFAGMLVNVSGSLPLKYQQPPLCTLEVRSLECALARRNRRGEKIDLKISPVGRQIYEVS